MCTEDEKYSNCMSIQENSDYAGRKMNANENISEVSSTPKSKYH
jgi:hypothetical protein